MTTPKRIPAAPKGSSAAARHLWAQVLERFDLDQHETALLRECCRTLTDLDALAAVVERQGVLAPDGKVHPALVEARQQRITLTRLVASLRLPEEVNLDARPQRRGAARGAYRVVGA